MPVSQNKADNITVFFAPFHIHLHEEVNVVTIDQELINFNNNCI